MQPPISLQDFQRMVSHSSCGTEAEMYFHITHS